VWDIAGGQCLATMENASWARHLSFSADGKVLTAAHEEPDGPPDRYARILTRWDAVTGKKLRRTKLGDKTNWSGGLSPDGRLFAHPTADGKVIRLIDADTGKEVPGTGGEASSPAVIAFSGDGRLMAASSRDGTARVWETATGKLRYRVPVPRSFFQRVALSHDGKLLAVSNWKE